MEQTHRRTQEATDCQGDAMQAMLTACCPAGGGAGNGHRRELQSGCSGFPASCSSECADLFVRYYEACQDMIAAMAAGQRAQFDGFISACSEKQQQIATVLDGATAAMIFHVVVLNPEAAQQTAMARGQSQREVIRPEVIRAIMWEGSPMNHSPR